MGDNKDQKEKKDQKDQKDQKDEQKDDTNDKRVDGKESSKLEQNKTEKQYTTNGRVALIGFWGGLIWSLLGYLFYALNFTIYGPSLILQPWALGEDLKEGVSGQIWGIVAICIASIILAFAYKFTLGRIKSMWVSVGFGLALWVLVFYVFQPFIPGMKPVMELGRNTVSTTLSLYVLFGLFVGYSISFDMGTVESDSDYYRKVDEKEVKAEK